MTALLTLDEVADRLKVSRRTVSRIVKAGQIRPIQVGRHPRVTERELDAYVGSLEGRRRR
jgi:excisionase family DNA binding protein